MMRRTSFRLSALCLATLFLVTATREALGLGCSHHELTLSIDAAAVAHQAGYPAAQPDGVAGEAEAAASAKAHTTLEAHPAPAAELPADHHGACTCLGNCNGTPGTPPIATVTGPLQAPATTVANLLGPAPEVNLPGPIPYLLPLAHAPPRDR